jgi:hypothetical protein
LHTLVIRNGYYPKQMILLDNFLSCQKKLERLSLVNLNYPSSGDTNSEIYKNMKFPLRYFEIDSVQKIFFNDENFKVFLAQFVDTMEEVHILDAENFHSNENLFEMLLGKYKKLSTLRIDPYLAPSDKLFYANLACNHHVTELIMDSYDAFPCREIMKRLPNIKFLAIHLEYAPSNALMWIAVLEKIYGSLVYGVRMPNVKSLKISYFPRIEPDEWKAIIKAFPNLEELVVGTVMHNYSFSDRMFNIITKQASKLSHLKLGKGFIGVKKVFNQLLRNSKNLKTVEVLQDAFKDNDERDAVLKLFKKDGLRFIIYPSDSFKTIFKESKLCSLASKIFASMDSYDSDQESDDEDYDDNDEEITHSGILLAFLTQIMHFPQNELDNESDIYDSDNEWLLFDSDQYFSDD